MASYDEYFEYTTIQGDTWDTISLDFYDDEHHASVLMNANPEHIKTLVFQEGIPLIIPIIEETAAESLPPWKRG